ncbi:membrane protein [Patiriisocius marinistellae]|uniref:Membrane protein n=1 Tax=Patiriisocius marinistellae TaxID=2494560 RepID=A0A5J4FX47_9FLAO|nr:lysylphosphatidylglycerol synthase transmembrane domain-containing protein [Patiriisocius marinistellae]GEQ84649.1 membrane protein [Patiriisocius marinistellae]
MNKTLSKILKIAIPLGLGIFLIWYIYQQFTPSQLKETKEHFKNAHYGFVALSVLLSILSHLSRAYRWSFMLQPLGYTPKLANNFMAISVAYLMNIFIPKSGEVSRGIILDKYENIPFEKGFGTIISERIVDLLFLLAFTGLALFLKFDVLYDYVVSSIPPSFLYKAVIAFVIFTALVLLFLKFSKSKINTKIKNFVIGLKDGVLSVVKMKKKGAFIFHTFLIWGLYLLSFYVATKALDETTTIGFGTIIIAFVVGSFTFAFTNSGFGTYPAAIAGILVLFSVPITAGTAFGWIVWTSNIASILIFGVLSLLLLPIYNKKT